MATALVTGASSGIGLEIARLLAKDYDLVLAARSADKLEQLASELGNARVVAVDLIDPDGSRKLIAEVPTVDVLVNNAGFAEYGPFAEANEQRLEDMIELNITALTRLSRAYLPGMLERGRGKIMNVASTASFQPGPLMAVYYATKAYVLSFSEALAEETRGSGVTVTALCPGPTTTNFQATANMEKSRLVNERMLAKADDVAKYGVKAMNKGDVVAVPGFMNKVVATSVRFSPRPVVRRLVHKIQDAK
ncbi:MAG TPA: SDR family oxidoreductase [Acidimicrobiia bacterium]|jgi:short-subunit dehydrogenase|nr:SDR family oxidoreductase [Acidimicrobiia bacterium]